MEKHITEEKKVDISPILYIIIMITVFSMSL